LQPPRVGRSVAAWTFLLLYVQQQKSLIYNTSLRSFYFGPDRV
jgi:hypothetical protein